MKRILVLCGVFTFLQMSSMAYIYENETASLEELRHQGFSKAGLEMVDWTKARNSSINNQYARYYQPKRNIFGRPYQKIKRYFDPIQDSGKFGDNKIEFSNTWIGDETFYSSDLKPRKKPRKSRKEKKALENETL